MTSTDGTYLGDAVYASLQGGMIRLMTCDGNAQVIYLDPQMYDNLHRFATKIWGPESDVQTGETDAAV